MKIDPEFQSLIPRLTIEEFNQLEQNILDDGEVHDPIIVWKGEDIIVDGHNRYAIIQNHPEIPYKIREKEFAGRDEVIAWMCCNQLGRRNLTEAQRSILLGRAYEARKIIGERIMNRDAKGSFAPNPDSEKTAKSVAREFGTTQSDVERSGRFVRGLDEIEAVHPGTIGRINSGELEVTKKDVLAVTKMTGEEKKNAINDIANGRRISKPLEIGPIARVPEHTSEYDINDFRSELQRKISTLDKSLELTCVLTHKQFLETEEGKDALRDTLLGMTEVIRKYMELC